MDGKRSMGLSRLGTAAVIGALASGQVLGGWYFLNRVENSGASPVAAMTVSSPEVEALRRQLDDFNAEVAQITSERDALRRDRDQLAESKAASLTALGDRLERARGEAARARADLSSRLEEEAAARLRLKEELAAARKAKEALDRALESAREQARKAEDAARKAEKERQRYQSIVQRLESAGLNVKRRAGLTAPPDLKAVVVRVLDQSQPTRLVIDVGTRHGIERDDIFELTRDGKSLGKARVISAEETICLARVMELKATESVLAGDSARTVREAGSDQ